jgi:hypothetical protein
MSVSMSVQEQIVKREEEHIGNLEKYENQIKQKTKSFEDKKVAFAKQFNFNLASSAADYLAKQCEIFINEIDEVRSNALCDVDGVLFEFTTLDNVKHKAMSKLVQKKKKKIEETVADLTRLTRQLQQSMSFVNNLKPFHEILDKEQNDMIALAGKKACPFCNKLIPIIDWINHATEFHAEEERMHVPGSERESFDRKNAKDDFQRKSRHSSPTASSWSSSTSSTTKTTGGVSGTNGINGSGGNSDQRMNGGNVNVMGNNGGGNSGYMGGSSGYMGGSSGYMGGSSPYMGGSSPYMGGNTYDGVSSTPMNNQQPRVRGTPMNYRQPNVAPHTTFQSSTTPMYPHANNNGSYNFARNTEPFNRRRST